MDRFFSYLRSLNTSLDVDAIEAFVWGNEMAVGVALGAVGFLVFYTTLRLALWQLSNSTKGGSSDIKLSASPSAEAVDADKRRIERRAEQAEFARMNSVLQQIIDQKPATEPVEPALSAQEVILIISKLAKDCVETMRCHAEASNERTKELASLSIEALAEVNRRCLEKFESIHERTTRSMHDLVESLTELADDDDE